MKLPTVFAKPILACFLFLFACFVFLLVAPNLTKSANAYSGTIQNVQDSDWSGQNVTFRWSPAVDIDGVNLIIVDYDDPDRPAVYSSIDHGINLRGRSSLTVNTADWNIAVHPPDGRFQVVLVWITAEVSNRETFTIPVSGSWSLTAGTPDGTKVTFTCGGCPNANVEIFVLGPDPDTTVRDQSGSMATRTTWDWVYGSASGTYTANLVAFGYNVVATTKVTISGPTPTPPPPPPGGDCTNAGTGQYVLGNSPAINGNNVTFTISAGSLALPVNSAAVLHVIYNPDTESPAGSPGAILGGSASWTAPGPGNYCAALVYITTQISNAVPFTVGAATGDTCTSSALNWVNDFRCRAIGGGWFDSDVFTAGQTVMTLESFNFIVWGESPMNERWATDTTKKTGALALTGSMVASLYSAPPASGIQYFAQKIHDLNPVTPAYAAAGGIGYQTLGPVQKIWIAFRNIAYVGFIIVFVIMGFMIMFRAHISPQAVATVQDSIPRLVIALILVTFSYAIAGFMIDIMFLVLNIAIQALVATKLINNADYIFKDNVFTVIWSNWGSVFKHVAFAVKDLIKDAFELPGGFVGDLAEKALGWTGGGLAALVIGIALLFVMFRIFLMLLMAYVMIILLTMFAPFFFLVQALPGNNGAKEWFRQMASNIAVFPTVALMFILAGILGGIGNLTGGGGGPAIQPAQIGQFPLIMGNLDAQAIGELVGIGFLLITPSAAEIVKNAMGGKGGGMGSMGAAAVGASLGAGAAVVGAAGRGAGNYIVQRSPIGTRMRAGQMLREERAAEQAQLPTFASTQKAMHAEDAGKPKAPRTS